MDHWGGKRKAGQAGNAESQSRRNRQSPLIQGVDDSIKNMGFMVRGTF